MSSFEKVVKLACKPKSAAPKAKYIEPLVAATYADDGSIHDICKALAPRFKEPNAVIVFKALIVLHSMIRQGQTDNVLKYLASSDVLRLRNVTNGQWDGYMAPQNLANYAMYLDCRVRTYKDLKHDAIRVQSESNRDRVSSADDEAPGSGRGVQRSKTVTGRKLRVMTVDKGLLRETKMVQKLTDALLECKLYDDNLDDELNVTALRMMVKDLLVLFQATNEGVINVLEHYFEMSQVDAQNALKIYQHFCKQTERVVNYLGVAKQLENVLNVQIPNLRHAPVSLAKTLEEYIKDPNFEDNRLDYRNSRLIADGVTQSKTGGKSSESAARAAAASKETPSTSTEGASTSKTEPATAKSEIMDFFASIEQEQPSMFDPQSQSPTNNYFQQQSQFNPFVQRQSIMTPQMTGMPNMNGQQPFIQPQATGFPMNPNNPFPQQQQPFLVPQQTAMPFQPTQQPFQPAAQPLQPQATAMPFLQPQATATPFLQPQATAAPFLQPQDTARPFQPQQQPFGQSAPFLQPQATGANPFRQTMLFPQSTGMPAQQQQTNPFPSNPSTPAIPGPFNTNNIARPASTPIGGTAGKMAPLVPQTTGSRNPFGPVSAPAPPPVPKLPTLGEIASGAFGSGGNNTGGGGAFGGGNNAFGSGNNAFGSANNGFGGGSNAFGGGNNAFGGNNPVGQNGGNVLGAQATGSGAGMFGQQTGSKSPFDMSSIASSFAFSDSSKDTSAANGQQQMKPLDPQATATSSAFSSDASSMFSSQLTGSSFSTTAPSLVPQPTGFGGSLVKPFKPTSSFGANMIDNLPASSSSQSNNSSSPFGAKPSEGTTPSLSFESQLGSQPTGNAFGGLSSQPTGFSPAFGGGVSGGAFGNISFGSGLGSGIGGGLRPQTTGLGANAGAANPFRASMFNNLGGGAGAGGAGNNPFPGGAGGAFNSQSPFGAQMTGAPTGFGGNSPFGATQPGQQQQQSQQQQQQPSFSLI